MNWDIKNISNIDKIIQLTSLSLLIEDGDIFIESDF